MFELQIIKRYLIPSKSSSNSLIANISIFTIALITWLLIVFLSVLKGVEKNWISKVVSLQAPIRLVPNEKYYKSDYYKKDSLSEENSYQTLNLLEKERIIPTNSSDELDIIAELKKSLELLQIKYDFYDVSAGIIQISSLKVIDGHWQQSGITQASYLTNPPVNSEEFRKIILKPNQHSYECCKSKDDFFSFFTPIDNLEPILLAKNFKDSGINIGDKVDISLTNSFSISGSGVKIFGYVCGFYDPGMMSIGTRMGFLRKEILERISLPEQISSMDPLLQGGVFLHIENISDVKKIVAKLKTIPSLQYFNIIPYYEFPFAKEILQQFESDQILFSFIGLIILLIACLNIISALILLVQEKRQEIGLMMALGASKNQIQFIFSSIGFIIGLLGFIIGSSLALVTLTNLDKIINYLMFLKGNPVFKILHTESFSKLVSFEILFLTLIITPLLAMISGWIPARKAIKIEPIEILKNG